MQLKRIKTIQSVQPFFKKGDTLVEYPTQKGVLYPEKMISPTGLGIPLDVFDKYGFKKYFKVLSPAKR